MGLASAECGALTVLRQEGLKELATEQSRTVAWATARLDEFLELVAVDDELRRKVNAWCRRQVAAQIERHHSLLGVLVEEQPEPAVCRIESRPGNGLNVRRSQRLTCTATAAAKGGVGRRQAE